MTDQSKTTRFFSMIPGPPWLNALQQGVHKLTHMYEHVKFDIVLTALCGRRPVERAKNQIQALTTTVNLVRGVASAMWIPQGHLVH